MGRTASEQLMHTLTAWHTQMYTAELRTNAGFCSCSQRHWACVHTVHCAAILTRYPTAYQVSTYSGQPLTITFRLLNAPAAAALRAALSMPSRLAADSDYHAHMLQLQLPRL